MLFINIKLRILYYGGIIKHLKSENRLELQYKKESIKKTVKEIVELCTTTVKVKNLNISGFKGLKEAFKDHLFKLMKDTEVINKNCDLNTKVNKNNEKIREFIFYFEYDKVVYDSLNNECKLYDIRNCIKFNLENLLLWALIDELKVERCLLLKEFSKVKSLPKNSTLDLGKINDALKEINVWYEKINPTPSFWG